MDDPGECLASASDGTARDTYLHGRLCRRGKNAGVWPVKKGHREEIGEKLPKTKHPEAT